MKTFCIFWAAAAALYPATLVSRFETASVTPSPSPIHNGYSAKIEGGPNQPATLTMRNVSLMFCIQQAYSVKTYQVTGPGWIKTARYDIVATLAPDAAPDQVWPALQALLAERLRLSIRRESKQLPVYILSVARGGPKLRAAASGPTGPVAFQPGTRDGFSSNNGTLRVDSASMAEFCGNLSRVTDRPIVDGTGLSGRFEFDFTYDKNSISAALQRQLGLKLESSKGAVEVLVVESALRVPAFE